MCHMGDPVWAGINAPPKGVVLDSPERGVYVPPLVWATQYRYSPDAMLLVLASYVYDADSYIRNYDDYLAAIRARGE